MTESPAPELPQGDLDLQHILLDLESKLKRTAEVLRQCVYTFEEEEDDGDGDHDEARKNKKNNNSDCGNTTPAAITAQDVVQPLEELQKYVDACDTLIGERLADVRQQVGVAEAVSRSYQRLYPEHHRRTCAAAAANAPGGLPPAEGHVPVGGGLCHEEVRHYLSRFVCWDPLGLTRATNSTLTAFGEAHRHGSSTGVGGAGNSKSWSPLFAPDTQPLLTGGSASTPPPSSSSSAQRPVRRSLNAVVDDLLLRQLQYDGISLSTAMQMELGCYDRMSVGSNVESPTDQEPLDVAIPQEMRRGLMKPVADHSDEGDVMQMVQKVYPRTFQWIVYILSACTCTGLHSESTVSLDEALSMMLKPVTGPSAMERPKGPQTVGEGFAQPSFLTEVDTQHQDEQQQQQELDAEEDANDRGELEASEGSQNTPLQRHMRRSVNAWAAFSTSDDSEGADEVREAVTDEESHEENEAEDETDYVGDSEEPSAYTEEEGEEAEEEEEAEEGESEEEAAEEVYEDELHRAQYSHHEEEEEGGQKRHQEEGGEMHGGHGHPWGEGQVQLVEFTTQRAKILLTDLIIICALQRLSQMVACGVKEEMKSTGEAAGEAEVTSEGAEQSASSATLQRAVNFILLLNQHPLVAWRLAAEREIQNMNKDGSDKELNVLRGDGTSAAVSSPPPTARATESLLVTFRHVLVALGYMPLLLGRQQQEEEEAQQQQPQGSNGADGRQAHDQLLSCVAPFLRLWGGRENQQNFDRLVPVNALSDTEDEDHTGTTPPAIPTYTTSFVWLESVFVDLLDQVDQLHRLESLLKAGDAMESSSFPADSAMTSRPESLLHRLVYPFSTFMLRQLDEYSEKGLVGEFDEEQTRVSFQLPPVVPPSRGGGPSHQQQQQQQQQQEGQSVEQQQHQPYSGGAVTDRRRPGLGVLRYIIPALSGFRGRDRASADESDNNVDATLPGMHHSQHQHQRRKQNRGQQTLMLELPHASTVLSRLDELHRHATPSFLYPQERFNRYAAHPALVDGSLLSWKPLFQWTMCYCPVTRRRCVDTFVCGVNPEGNRVSSSAFRNTPGFNPAQLLKCGHVISNVALTELVDRLQRNSRGSASYVQCPYCCKEVALNEIVMLRCIY